MQRRDRARFSPEFKDEAVRLVVESGRPIAQVARELGINDGTLGNWVVRYRDEHPVSESPLGLSERARLQELERENRQLRLDNEFLGKAALGSARDRNATVVGQSIWRAQDGEDAAGVLGRGAAAAVGAVVGGRVGQ